MSSSATATAVPTATAAAGKGLEGVVAARTNLSDVQGDVGKLIYVGYDIDELAGKVSYEEVVYLLHHGHLPNRAELDELRSALVAYRELPKGVIDIIKKFPRNTPPMHALRTAIDMNFPVKLLHTIHGTGYRLSAEPVRS